jgi:predicted HD superfamily hydrolase involved in NAD metabolism
MLFIVNKEKILKLIPRERLQHSLNVANEAKLLAERYQVSNENAELAGLLHDIAKYVSLEDLQKENISITKELHQIYLNFQKIFHAFIAPIYVEQKLGITNKDVLSALKWHTTGKANMKILEQIVFIADYIEESRDTPQKEFIKKLAYFDLDLATYSISKVLINYLISINRNIHTYTLECKDYYEHKIFNN